MKYFYTFLTLLCFQSLVSAQAAGTDQIWINEFHYNGFTSQGTTDQNEFIEIAVASDLAANPTELAKYEVVLYANGGDDLRSTDSNVGKGLPYDQSSLLFSMSDTYHALNEASVDGSTGFQTCDGGTGVTYFYKQMPTLQDMAAGIGIIYDNTTVVQLLSYEEAFKIKNDAAAGAAAGENTTLIVDGTGQPLTEASLTSQTTNSIYLTGTGNQYSDFTWAGGITSTATPCAANTSQAAVLPVEFLYFTGRYETEGIQLKWATAVELNNKGFHVERRAATERNFTELQFVAGAGTTETEQSYAYLDTEIRNGESYYYRLRQVDFDGTEAFSNLIVVDTEAATPGFTLTPNPVRTDLTITPSAPIAGKLTIDIFSTDGRLVDSRTLAGETASTVNVATLPRGLYSVRLRSDQVTETLRLVVE